MKKKKRFEKWEKRRVKGKKNFVIYSGVLGWGVTIGVLNFIVGEMLDYRFLGEWMFRFIFKLVCFMLGGILVGSTVWRINERDYNKHQYKKTHSKKSVSIT
ncbi:hypothetical protein WAK64_08075 [Bacillus spongiae]|uniref:Uncharacterized protein n=1 Tax=Bacillus spongiae TaxID=2683610 RepID=A0ABU8HCN3_9BACI